MKKRVVLILSVAAFFSLGLTLSAQDYNKKQKVEPTREEASSEEKYNNLEKNQQVILRKLDLILSNQEKIMEELKIIKVRASRK